MRKRDVNAGLLNLISPMGIQIRHDGFYMGDQRCRVYGGLKYPPRVGPGWLTGIFNTPGTVASVTFEPVDAAVMIEAVNRNIVQNRGLAGSAREPLMQQRAEKAARDGERILQQVDQNGETVGILTLLVMPYSPEEEAFQLLCRRLEALFKMGQIRARGLSFLQEEGLKAVSPYHVPQARVTQAYGRLTPLSSFLGGFPFSTPGYNDGGTGYYVARDASGGMIVLDFWKRGGDRTNSNMVFTGVSGQGKSTAIKSILISEFMKGTTVIVIDAEKEYAELCRNLGGDLINAGGGAGGRINPLQIRPMPKDEEEEEAPPYGGAGSGMGNLALHLKSLEIFFSLYLPDLGERERIVLKQALKALYARFGITWDTDTSDWGEERFPTFSDLYALLLAHLQQLKAQGADAAACESLAFSLQDIAQGADQFIWNGHTTVQADSAFICLSTHDLQNTSEAVRRTQYYNILTWCWQRMSRDRRERVLLVADEAYMMIDPHVPQSLEFMRNVSKRARKYEAAVAIISQSVVDFLDPSVRMYGLPLLDMPTYKFLFGCDGQSLRDLAALYDLNDAEQGLLLSKKQGNALMMVGARRLRAVFQVPGYKMACMGAGGGR